MYGVVHEKQQDRVSQNSPADKDVYQIFPVFIYEFVIDHMQP